MSNVKITSTACYLPKQVLTNKDIIERFNLDVDEEWIESRTGIKQRHWLEDGDTTSDMAVEAAREILKKRNIQPHQLDKIILATVSGDYPSPATAFAVARKLGTRCAAFDISAACCAFIYGLEIASGFIQNGDKYVLLLCADARSRFIDKTDRRGVVLFSDGAAGALLEPSADKGLLSIHLGADGTHDPIGTCIPTGGATKPITAETVANGEHFLRVDGLKDIFKVFVEWVVEAVDHALTKSGLTLDDIDVFIPHQGNAFLIEKIIEVLNIPAEKTINNVWRHGNTSGACIPIALAEGVDSGRIKPGDKVLMTTAGAGNTFAAVVHQF